MSKNEYGVDKLDVLDPIEHIYRKTTMYAPNFSHVVYELLSNSADECMAGYGDRIELTLHKDQSISVRDYGRGIPFEYSEKHKKNGIDIALFTVNAGGKMDNTKENGGYEISSGSYGVGSKIATATAEKMQVDVWRDGKHATRIYSYRKAIGDLKIEDMKPEDKRGTNIRWKPEESDGLWGKVEFSPDGLKELLKSLCYMLPKLTCVFINENTGKSTEYHYPNGILDMVTNMITSNTACVIKTPIRITEELDGVPNGIDIAFTYAYGAYESGSSYCNNVKLSEGGSHVEGFRMGLTKAINDAARNLGVLKQKDDNFNGNEIRESLLSVVSVKLKSPRYANQTKTKIDNPDIRPKIAAIVYNYLKEYFLDNPKEAVAIAQNTMNVRNVRAAMKRAKEIAMNKNGVKQSFKSKLDGKLVPCKSKKAKETELLICEGR